MPVLKKPQYEAFAQAVVAGKSYREACMEAFSNTKDWKYSSIASKANDLSRNPDIQARIQELRNMVAAEAILTRQARMELLTEIATDESQSLRSRLSAIDILNKMDGEYVKRIDANISGDLDATAAKIAAILDDDDSGEGDTTIEIVS